MDDLARTQAELTDARALLDASYDRERRFFGVMVRLQTMLADAAVKPEDDTEKPVLLAEAEKLRAELGQPVPRPEGLLLEYAKTRARCASVEKANVYLREQVGRLTTIARNYDAMNLDRNANHIELTAERDALLSLMGEHRDVALAAMAAAVDAVPKPEMAVGEHRAPASSVTALQATMADTVHALWNHGEKERARKLATQFSIDLPDDTVSKGESDG